MKLTIYLRPHCAKYLQKSCDVNSPLDLTKPFGRLVCKSIIENPQGRPRKFDENLIAVELRLPVGKHHREFRSDRKSYTVDPLEMPRIDEYIDQLFRFEIMKSIEQRGTMQKKDVFLSILDRFDMTSDDFSFDAMAKFEQRYKKKSPNSLIFG